MNILITGGAGYLGSVLVGEILNQPWLVQDEDLPNIRVLDSLMYKQDGMIPYCSERYPNFEFVLGDVRDESLEQHVEWADVVIPLAAIVGFPACEKDKTLATDVNYNQVVRIAQHYKAKKIVYPNTNSG